MTNTIGRIIVNELQRASKSMKQIEAGKAGWDSLFEPVDYFNLYKSYLQVDLASFSREELNTW